MNIKTFLLVCVTTLLISCNKADVYSKLDKDFPHNRWEQTDAKTYEFTITDDTKLYDLIFRFSYVYDYQFSSVPLDFTITHPSGKEEKFSVNLQIKDSSGTELGDCIGDLCDLHHTIKEKAKLAKGNYKLKVSNSFHGPYLPNVFGVGLDVATAK